MDIEFFDNLVLEDVFATDQNGDTLFNIYSLKGDIKKFDTKAKIIELNALELNDPYFYLSKGEDAKTNIQFLIEYFKKENESQDDWYISSSEVQINNGHFIYVDKSGTPKRSDVVDFKNLDISNLNARAENFELKGEEASFLIENLALNEKSGFQIDELALSGRLSNGTFTFNNISLKTPNSELNSDYALSFNSKTDFSDFENKIHQNVVFRNALVHLSDLNFFTPFLDYFEESIFLSGSLNGSINDLSFENLSIETGSYTSIQATGYLKNILDSKTTFIDTDIKKLKTHYTDIQRSLATPLKQQGKDFDIPDNLRTLGRISANGNYKGTLSEFLANGFVNTEVGAVEGNMLFKQEKDGVVYNGNIKTNELDLGRILEIKDMSSVNMSGEISGRGLSIKNLKSDIKVDVISLGYKGHLYENAKINGKLAQNKFEGDFAIAEKEIDLNFSGNLDFTTKKPVLNFDASVKHLNFAALNLLNDSTAGIISGNVNANLVGLDLDETIGTLSFDSLSYKNDSRSFEFGKGELAFGEIDSLRSISVNSELLDASVMGTFELKKIDKIAFSILTHHLPSVYSQRDTTANKTTFVNFDFNFKNSRPITDLFIPQLTLSNDFLVQGEFNNVQNKFDFVIEGDTIQIGKTQMINVFTEGVQNYYQGYFTGEFEKIKLSEKFEMDNVWLTNSAFQDTLESDMTWTNKKYNSNGSFSLLSHIQSWEKQVIKVLPSEIVIANDYWHIENETNVYRDGKEIIVDELRLTDKEQEILLDGNLSLNPDEEFNAIVSGFDIKRLNPFLPEYLFDLDGTINTELVIRDVYNDLVAEVNGEIKKLSLSGEEIGDLNISSSWDRFQKLLALDGDLISNDQKQINIKGNYSPLNENNLDLILDLNHFDLSHLNTIPSKKVSEISGNANGKITVRGTFLEPLLDGELELEQAGLKINYLNTKFRVGDKERADSNRSLSNKLKVRNDAFLFDLMPIKDEQGNFGDVTASINHENFKDWNFDAYANFEDPEQRPFLLLNTSKEQNPLYYGTAYAKGYLSIDGYDNKINMELNARSDSGTVLNIPLGESGTSSIQNFVTFVDFDSLNVQQEKEIDFSGINLDMNIEITEDALVNLIFDEKIGDVMKGRGAGNLNMNISPGSDFSMVGRYEVVKGDYLFTLRNSINKKFEVKPGGSITWYGDPYNAELDLQAIYKTRSSIYDLVLENPENWRKRIPVECSMNLSQSLLNPEIDFDITFPSLNAGIRTAVEDRINTDAEKNKQVFGLLVLNKFFPPQDGLYTGGSGGLNGLGVGAGAETNTFELLSNQLSNWLTQIFSDIDFLNGLDIGLNYRPGDEISQEELAVALSTQLLEDRITLYGNFGVYNEAGVSQKTTNVIGDFVLEYILDKNARNFKLKVFNETNDFDFSDTNQSPTTQGIGLLYEQEYDTFKEFMKAVLKRLRPDNNEENEP